MDGSGREKARESERERERCSGSMAILEEEGNCELPYRGIVMESFAVNVWWWWSLEAGGPFR